MKALVVSLLLGGAALGCGAVSDAGADRIPDGPTHGVAVPDAGRGASGGRVHALDAGAGAVGALDASALPPDLVEKPTVWIGEFDQSVTLPAVLHAGSPPERVVLILDAIRTGVTGTITFGDGPPPPPPKSANSAFPPSTEPVLMMNYLANPYVGFSYSLTDWELKGDVLVLSFAPGELFRDWCALQTSPGDAVASDGERICDCVPNGACRAVTRPIRRISVAVSGNTMEGELIRGPAASWEETPQVRLQRVE